MADNSILTPGYGDNTNTPIVPPETTQYLLVDNYLSEYSSDDKSSTVRDNLGAASKDEVYTKLDTDIKIAEKISEAINKYLDMEDPHGIIPTVEEMIEGMVKIDGNTPFIAPQVGVDPYADNHLTTKKFVTRLLKDHINSDDPHNILSEVRDILEKYVKTADIYSKSLLYTKQEVDKQLGNYLKKDGTTPFTKALVGSDPIIDSHLATKRYVDKTMYSHLVEVDPHGFLAILNDRLAKYIKKKDVYDKTLTYSRSLIDFIINKIVEQAIDSSIADYIDQINDKFEQIRLQKYIKLDGTVPFNAPQQGVDAVNLSDLVTLKLIRELEKSILDSIHENSNTWITSGPSEATVGNVEINTDFPDTMSIQEVFDAIFYGRGVSLHVPEYTNITKECKVTVCIHGTSGLIDHAELYLGDILIYTFSKDDFVNDRCVTVNSNPILENTQFTFKVMYLNGVVHEESKIVKCSIPIFVGLLPKWKFGNTITYEYLLELINEDSTNNKFYHEGGDDITINHKYDFSDTLLKHIMIVVPETYPDLYQMRIPSQLFDKDAFDIIDRIPLLIPGVESDTIYKIYIYKLALCTANLETTFKLKNNE